MPLDPQVEIILGLVKKANLPEFWQLTPDQGREQYLTARQQAEVQRDDLPH